MATAHSFSGNWDIFCKVVDNYGDAGVCWRLARMLVREHRLAVRLWIDHPAALQALNPGIDAALPIQKVDGVEVRHWTQPLAVVDGTAVVIEAFGCGLPEEFVNAMAACRKPPLWIVLEYLSAETWVDQHHGLASPHPRLPLPRYFFFPGFTAASGGLLREADLLQRRDAFDAMERGRFWQRLGFDRPAPGTLTVSLFCYADAPIERLLEAMAGGDARVVVAVPGTSAMPALDRYFGMADPGERIRIRGALEVRTMPFLPQIEYDDLLWTCDLNFVRGEDSFVRAQWAARPMVWQPYRQDDGAHLRKMEAFLGRYRAGLASGPGSDLEAFWRAWNGDNGVATAWSGLRGRLPVLAPHARRWAAQLAGIPDLASRLVEFARDRVE